MILPNFLIIGVEKAGTSSVYNYLKQHPQVYMSPIKETNFLEKDWENIDPSLRRIKKNGIYTFEDYCQLFKNVKDEIAIGEVSPNYLFHYQTSCERILRYVPNTKMMAIIRNPIDRAYSDYLMHVRDVIGKETSLSDNIRKPKKSFIISKGFYYEPLKYFFDKFGSSKIKVFLYDDLCKNSIEFMQDMYRFITVDDSFCPNTSEKHQVAQVPKNKFLNKFLRKQNPVRSYISYVLKYVLPYDVRQNVRSKLIELNSDDKKKMPMKAEDRKQLVELYREDILKLQDLIERDLSSWLID